MQVELRERTEENVRIYFERTRDPEIQARIPQRSQTVEQALEAYRQSLAPGAASYGRTVWADGVYVYQLAVTVDDGLAGVTEVVSFDESAVVLRTSLGSLLIQGKQLQLKTLSLDGGQVAVEGTVSALVYEEPRQTGFWRRLLG